MSNRGEGWMGKILRCLSSIWCAAALAQTPQSSVDVNQQAVVATSEGALVLSFYPEKAPKHVQLFLKLAAEGAYDETLFHRVIKWGIIQGGDPFSKDPAKKS